MLFLAKVSAIIEYRKMEQITFAFEVNIQSSTADSQQIVLVAACIREGVTQSLICLLELKIGIPVSPVFSNEYTNFDFSLHFCLQVRNSYGTDGQDP